MPAACDAVVAEVSRPEFLSGARAAGEYMMQRLRALSAEKHLGEVRGRGLLAALDLGGATGAAVVEAALANGLLVNSPRPECLRFMPALNVTHAEIDEMLVRLRAAL